MEESQPENETLPLVQFWQHQQEDAITNLPLRDQILDEMWEAARRRGPWWWGPEEIQREVDRVRD